MPILKNINLGKINFKILILSFLCIFNAKSDVNNSGSYVEIKILDKVNSKSSSLNIRIGESKNFKNLVIKVLKCKNSEFDDNPDVTAYLQVKDITQVEKDKVFVFNGWTFASSPSIKPFDHPIYDIWLTRCIY
tara:strand:- start:92 stop:490 length:399 start_codon:yes stop_codon:yes gene_type:complete